MSEEKNNQSNKSGGSLTALVAGAVIGAALFYLFGTKSGQKVRDHLLRETKSLLDKLGENLEETKEGTKEAEEKPEESAISAPPVPPTHIEEIQKKGRRFFFHRHHSLES